MIKSTNQVTQMFVVTESCVKKVLKDPTGSRAVGVQYVVDGNDTTDMIPLENLLGINLKSANDASEKMFRKVLVVKLNKKVNNGVPVEGQDYILSMKFRGHIGEEDTIEKVAMAHAAKGDTAAVLLQKLAKSLIDNASVEASPLYEIHALSSKAPITDVSTITADGFAIVEAKPYWRLGTFTEALAKIDVATSPIEVSSEEEDKWLDTYKFVADTAGTYTDAIFNTHKVADMEYFYKGERGVSAFLNAPYDAQMPVDLKVNPKAASGYDILTIHYAYVGANASNQKSEKDLVIVEPYGTGKLATIKSELEALTVKGQVAAAQKGIEELKAA